MDALKQYLELFREHTELINSGGSPLMASLRKEAYHILRNISLPQKGSENYNITDLQEILAPDYGLNLGRLNLAVDKKAPFHCGVPNLTNNLFFLQNDIYTETPEAHKGLPEGLYVGSLRHFCENYPEMARHHYGALVDLKNPLVALNTMLAQDGIVIWAKKGVKHIKPIQIVGILESKQPLMAVRRILVIAEEGSEVKVLICDHTQSGDVKFLNLVTTEIYSGKGASVDICEMEESTKDTCRLSSCYIRLYERSKVNATGVTLYNGRTRNEYYGSFSGKEAELKLSGMAIVDGRRIIDSYSVVDHVLPGCHTDELFKYVVDEEARGVFSGLIKVQKGASKTEAYQSNRNLIGSEKGRVFSKPMLEIYEDDVKCSHGTTIGQLDPTQIFYMQTRGLTEAQARFLLKQAFMADVIDRIPMEEFRFRLHNLVERRFAGDFHNCASCKNHELK